MSNGNGADKARLEEAITRFLQDTASERPSDNDDLVRRILRTVARLDHDGLERLDLKIIERALRELHRGFRTFAPWRGHRKIAVFGSARTGFGTEVYAMAEECARLLVAAEFMVVTGAGPGIMEAANRGAGIDHTFGVNIHLPFEQRANDYIDPSKLAEFKYFFTRKVVFVKETDGVILFPGGFGTQDEGFETLTLVQTGKTEPKPIVMIERRGSTYWEDWDDWVRTSLLGRGLISQDDVNLYLITQDPAEAVRHVALFYANYHSIRYVEDSLLLRLQHRPSDRLIEELNDTFSDIVVSGRIERVEMAPGEKDEPETRALHRLRFRFDQKHLSRLRGMIDVLNKSLTDEQIVSHARMPAVHGILPTPFPDNVDADEEP